MLLNSGVLHNICILHITLFLGLADQVTHLLPLLLGTQVGAELQQTPVAMKLLQRLSKPLDFTDSSQSGHTFFLHNFRARLSLPTFKSSVTLLSYGARPATSLTTSRISLVLLPHLCKTGTAKAEHDEVANQGH